MNVWIPIEKELPKHLETLLVTVEHQHRWVSFAWIGSDGVWHYADNGERMPKEYRIIAWQPLPEPYLEIEINCKCGKPIKILVGKIAIKCQCGRVCSRMGGRIGINKASQTHRG